MTVPENEIDAGAQALRDRQMQGRVTLPWEKVPQSAKRKWLDHAACVLTAAYSARKVSDQLKKETT